MGWLCKLAHPLWKALTLSAKVRYAYPVAQRLHFSVFIQRKYKQAYAHGKLCIRLFIEVLYVLANKMETPKIPINNRIDN